MKKVWEKEIILYGGANVVMGTYITSGVITDIMLNSKICNNVTFETILSILITLNSYLCIIQRGHCCVHLENHALQHKVQKCIQIHL